ncbi:LysE family transporter [Streptomyces sp. NPDC091259]|uniref:LysE family transporter n=1 Tax=Streptomyces sp. NPDC091259 TaxID=3365976 RepID=UPI003826BC55
MSDPSALSALTVLSTASGPGGLPAPALSGAVAGLGVAMPMGAMSVLLLQEAMRHRRTAVAAAAGIAVVDLGYAASATALGPWVATSVGPVEAWVRLAAGIVLLTIAARGLRATRRARAAPPAAAPPCPAAPAPAGGRPTATFARYVGLTAVNPTTALYFAALTTAQGASLRTGGAVAAFLAGVGLASLVWQQLLVVVGSLAAARISPEVRLWTFRLGYGLVAAYALKIVFPLP